jgi:hypothetical protein
MSKEKAELVDRLNAIQRLISEQGLWADPKLLDAREKVLKELDLISNQEKGCQKN